MVHLSIATFNVLADCWVHYNPDTTQWYPDIPPEQLTLIHRIPVVLSRIRAFGADIVCLQEVDSGSYPLLKDALTQDEGFQGYQISPLYPNQKSASTIPNGVAVLWRVDTITKPIVNDIIWDARSGTAGCVLQGEVLSTLGGGVEVPRIPIAVLCCHLDHGGDSHRQCDGVLNEIQRLRRDGTTFQVVCGDLNTRLGQPVVRRLVTEGEMMCTSREHSDNSSPTYLPGQGRGKRIDHILYWGHPTLRRGLHVESIDVPTVPTGEGRPWVVREYGSDHLPVVATFKLTRDL